MLDRAKCRRWQNANINIIKVAWFTEHGPCVYCGSWKNLEVDHIDPTLKTIPSYKLWHVSQQRRNKELENCQVLCGICHKKKHAAK